MSATPHRHSCLQLGVCQDRPTCAECTRLHGGQAARGQTGAQTAAESAIRIERLINSRYRHTVLEPLPQQQAPGMPPDRSTRGAAWFCLLCLMAALSFTLIVASGRAG